MCRCLVVFIVRLQSIQPVLRSVSSITVRTKNEVSTTFNIPLVEFQILHSCYVTHRGLTYTHHALMYGETSVRGEATVTRES